MYVSPDGRLHDASTYSVSRLFLWIYKVVDEDGRTVYIGHKSMCVVYAELFASAWELGVTPRV